MNEAMTRLEVRSEVSAFVAQVRDRLGDLEGEVREELVGGLEADIAELVADGGSVSELGDPRAYADELRAAAGIERAVLPSRPEPEEARRFGQRRAAVWAGGTVAHLLDRARRRWAEVVEVPALRGTWEFLVTLRPAWWVMRAWVAMQLLDLVTQARDMTTLLPMVGGPVLGSLLWVAAVVASVQIGRNRLWPGAGPQRRAVARAVLLGLNALAIVVTPVVLATFPDDGTWAGQGYGYTVEEPPPGLVMNGEAVANVFPYDAEGNPLTGVQLFDQDGRPLSVTRTAGEVYDELRERVTVTYPWFNGEQRLYNVFPLPRREQAAYPAGWQLKADAWTSTTAPSLPTPPLAAVPPASLPLPVDGSGAAETETQESAGAGDHAPTESGGGAGSRDSENRTGR
jgi:hypothetical protein